jgi:raffinose/stachyose/melibiose transport system permease protein
VTARPSTTLRTDAPASARRFLATLDKSSLIGYLYVLPALALYAAFVLYPLIQAAGLSLLNWDGITAPVWVGLRNYQDMVGDPAVRTAFLHAVELIGFYSLLPISIGLIVTGAIAQVPVRGLLVFRTVLFLPQVIPMVAVGVVWALLYAPDGPLNSLLQTVGLGGLARPWLGDFALALPAIGLVAAWVLFGLCLVLFTAGVQKIPSELYEAARVDGAGPIAGFLAVTVPGLRNEISVALTLTVVASLRSFDLVFVTTKGGPGDSTIVPGVLIYQRAFQYGQVGSAAALAIGLALLIFAVTFLITRLQEESDT